MLSASEAGSRENGPFLPEGRSHDALRCGDTGRESIQNVLRQFFQPGLISSFLPEQAHQDG